MSQSEERLKQTDFRLCITCDKLHMSVTNCPVCAKPLTLVDYTFFTDKTIGRYKIEKILGIGGMGIVFKAIHQTLNKNVAIKFFIPTTQDETFEKRFLREARILAGLKHPNIIEVYDFDISSWGMPFYVMEYLEGQTLGEIIRSFPNGMPLKQVSHTLDLIVRGLKHAHNKGIVHRDLKPDNIFIEKMHDQDVLKILDFGIAKSLVDEESARLTATETVLGTPYYLTPEQILNKNIGPHTDQYSLALIVGEMLSGKVIRGGKSIGEILYKEVHNPIDLETLKEKRIPVEIGETLIKATMPKSNERFSHIEAFGKAIFTAINSYAPDMQKTLSQTAPRRKKEPSKKTFLSIEEEVLLEEKKKRMKKVFIAAAVTITISAAILLFLILKPGEIKKDANNTKDLNKETIQLPVKQPVVKDESPPDKQAINNLQVDPKRGNPAMVEVMAKQIITAPSDTIAILTSLGNTILVSGNDGIYLIDRLNPQTPSRIPMEERILGGLPNGFIVSANSYAITARNFIDGTETLLLRNPPPGNIIKISTDNKFLAVKKSTTLTLYYLENKKKTKIKSILTSKDDSAFIIEMSSNYLAYIDRGMIHVMQLGLEPGKLILNRPFEQSELAVEAIAINDRRGLLAIGGKFGTIYVYDLKKKGQLHRIKKPGQTRALTFRTDSPTLFIAKENKLLTWTLGKKMTKTYKTPFATATSIVISPNALLALDKNVHKLMVFPIK
jgi:serine/threonine protein kinase